MTSRNYRQAPCYTKGRGGRRITTIVIHHWDDPAKRPSFDGTVGWFASGRGNNSAHYVVEAGRITQMVSEHDTAWHAGHFPTNQVSIGIECNPRASDADKRTIAELIREIQARHGKLKIVGHKDVSSTGCPGRYYPPVTILAPYLGSTPPKPTTPAKSTPKPAAKPQSGGKANIEALADAVIAGKYGNGDARKKALGANYTAVQQRVNEKLSSKKPKPTVDIEAMARDVIAGKYGNGNERRRRLGANYDAVQKRVKQLLK